jgi:hypothetical protein
VKTRSEINRANALQRKPGHRHPFTDDECSRGGAAARDRERACGVRLNHGVVFGRRRRTMEAR